MRNINKDEIKKIAQQIFLDFNDEECEFFLKEFNIFLKQLENFENDKEIDNFEPISFPFLQDNYFLREDIVKDIETPDDILKNAKNKVALQLKIPKVIEYE